MGRSLRLFLLRCQIAFFPLEELGFMLPFMAEPDSCKKRQAEVQRMLFLP